MGGRKATFTSGLVNYATPIPVITSVEDYQEFLSNVFTNPNSAEGAASLAWIHNRLKEDKAKAKKAAEAKARYLAQRQGNEGADVGKETGAKDGVDAVKHGNATRSSSRKATATQTAKSGSNAARDVNARQTDSNNAGIPLQSPAAIITPGFRVIPQAVERKRFRYPAHYIKTPVWRDYVSGLKLDAHTCVQVDVSANAIDFLENRMPIFAAKDAENDCNKLPNHLSNLRRSSLSSRASDFAKQRLQGSANALETAKAHLSSSADFETLYMLFADLLERLTAFGPPIPFNSVLQKVRYSSDWCGGGATSAATSFSHSSRDSRLLQTSAAGVEAALRRQSDLKLRIWYELWMRERRASGKPLNRLYWNRESRQLPPAFTVFQTALLPSRERMSLRRPRRTLQGNTMKVTSIIADLQKLQKLIQSLVARDRHKLLMAQVNCCVYDQMKKGAQDPSYLSPLWVHLKSTKLASYTKIAANANAAATATAADQIDLKRPNESDEAGKRPSSVSPAAVYMPTRLQQVRIVRIPPGVGPALSSGQPSVEGQISVQGQTSIEGQTLLEGDDQRISEEMTGAEELPTPLKRKWSALDGGYGEEGRDGEEGMDYHRVLRPCERAGRVFTGLGMCGWSRVLFKADLTLPTSPSGSHPIGDRERDHDRIPLLAGDGNAVLMCDQIESLPPAASLRGLLTDFESDLGDRLRAAHFLDLVKCASAASQVPIA